MSVQCVQAAGTKLEAVLIKYHLCFHVHQRCGILQTCRNHYLGYSLPCELQDTKPNEWLYGIRREFRGILLQFCHLMNDAVLQPLLIYTRNLHQCVEIGVLNFLAGLTSPLPCVYFVLL